MQLNLKTKLNTIQDKLDYGIKNLDVNSSNNLDFDMSQGIKNCSNKNDVQLVYEKLKQK